MKKITFTLFVLFMASVTLAAQPSTEKDRVAKTLNDLETAIINNNAKQAGEILHEEAAILEGGKMETKSQYLSHHFQADGKFLAAMHREKVSQTIKIEGNVAWVTSKTKMTGRYSGRDIDMNSLELAVLKKENNVWKVVALHWSSR
jgi:ketosteroid isomerase-like protein